MDFFNSLLRPRSGLKAYLNLGSDPIRGVFAKAGVFDGALFTVAGGSLFSGSTLLGFMANDGLPARFAASDTELVITSGGSA
jgi:hypothetical protein